MEEIEAITNKYNEQMTNLSIAIAVLKTIIESLERKNQEAAPLQGALMLFNISYDMENDIQTRFKHLEQASDP